MNWRDKIEDVHNRWQSASDYFEIKTSGSTGKPKSIVLEKRRMQASAEMSLAYFGLKEGQKVLLAIPADKVGGMMLIIRSIIGKLDLIMVEPKLNPFLKIDLEEKIEFCSLTPAQLSVILKHKESYEIVSKIKTILLGGSAISYELENEIREETNQYFHSYGMTETISHIAIKNLSRGDEYFEALSGVKFEVNQEDQLIIQAPLILHEPLLTNDLVELKSASKMIWKGRKDNVVNSGGYKIIIEELEAEIRRKFEGDFYLIGEKDPIYGERLVMISKTMPSDLSFLDKLKRPKEIYIRPQFEYTINGKLLRLSPQQLSEL